MNIPNPNYPGHTLEVLSYRQPLENAPYVFAVNVASDGQPAFLYEDKCSAAYLRGLLRRIENGALRIHPASFCRRHVNTSNEGS